MDPEPSHKPLIVALVGVGFSFLLWLMGCSTGHCSAVGLISMILVVGYLAVNVGGGGGGPPTRPA